MAFHTARNLPTDVWTEIIGHLHPHRDSSTLLELSLVSHSLKSEAQRVLFSRGPITFTEHTRRRPWGAPNLCGSHSMFFNTILDSENMYLAGYILEYTHFTRENTYHNVPQRDIDQLNDLFIQALPLMGNLKSLTINFTNLGTPHARALSTTSPFQLRSLTCTFDTLSNRFVRKFLETQTALKHLAIYWGSPNAIPLPVNLLPDLVSLATCNLAVWRRLAAIYDIKALSLRCYGDFNVDETNIPALQKVKYLQLIGGRGNNPFDDIGALSVRAGVEIQMLYLYDVRSLDKNVYDLVPRLAHLRTLIVWDPISSRTPASPHLRRTVAIAFARSKSLLHVFIPTEDITRGILYRRSAPAHEAIGDGPVLEEFEVNFDTDAQCGADWWVRWAHFDSVDSVVGLISGANPTIIDMSGEDIYRSLNY